VKKCFAVQILAIALALLAGCTSSVTHYPPVTDSVPGRGDSQTPVEVEPAPGEVIVPETPDVPAQPQPPLINPAVNSLINQARAQYNAGNYPSAIATAERGLRIDRRTPELYLVLAQSYLQQSNTQQAKQFVQQGLRFAQSGSAVADSLRRVQTIIADGDF